jgi:proteic killer suppression protein
MAIKSFAHKGVEEVFRLGRSKRIGSVYTKRMNTVLDAMNGASSADDLHRAYGFHRLTGDLAGHYAMTITGNWRLVFRFEDGDKGDILDVDFIDYH